MKRLVVIGVLLFFIILFTNEYYKLEYGIGLWQYHFGGGQTLTAEELQWLKEKQVLVYGADNNSPPLRYVQPKTQQYEGLVIDYLQALSLEIGVPIEYKPMTWSQALKELSEGNTDICDMYPSEDRAKDFYFTDPVYYQRGSILTLRGKGITSKKQLEGKVISANKGDYVIEYLRKNYEQVKTIETQDLEEAIKLLEEGKVQAVLGDESVLNDFVMDMNLQDRYVILPDYLYEREAVFGVQKNQKKLVGILNKAIAALNKRQTMEKIHQKWFGVSPLITKNRKIERNAFFAKYLLIAGLIGAMLLYLWNVQLKKEVQKRTRELSFSRNQLETTFNGLTHLLVVIDEDCFIVEANRTFCDKVELSSEQIKNLPCEEINILSDKENGVIEKVRMVLEEQNNKYWEMKYNGHTYRASSYPLEIIPGAKNRILLMMEDVTELKVAEQTMLQNSKMVAVGQLAAGVAHEIRNPLGIIRNNAYLLKRMCRGADEITGQLQGIEGSVDRANRIIENLLNFSRITDDRKTRVDIKQFVSSIIALSEKVMQSKKIHCQIRCKEELFEVIHEESLKHILMNLTSNAIDAMPDGGEFAIEIIKTAQQLIITVSDTGMGMSEEVKENIFNPFYTTKEPGSGTGLGLYIAYNEIEKMGGVVAVESAIQKGTTFKITLPI